MSGLILADAFGDDTAGNGLTFTLSLFFAPGSAGASIALRDFLEGQDATVVGGEVLSITSRRPNGVDVPIPATPPPIGSFTSTGAAFDPTMSSVTYGFVLEGAFAQWVLQVIFF